MNIQTLIPTARPIAGDYMASGKYAITGETAKELCGMVPLPPTGYCRLVDCQGVKLKLALMGENWTVQTIYN